MSGLDGSAPDDALAPSLPLGAGALGHQRALDGLRAVAVLAVMCFHANVSWAVGGYLGVDAFFVLSGFLITCLLLTEWLRSRPDAEGRGAINLRTFYARRVRRLFPAMALMLLGVGLYAAFVASPAELDTIRGDALATIGYAANWRQMLAPHGYFAQLSAPSPLRHTWSLAVEEQWYLVWPLVLAGCLVVVRMRLRTVLWTVVGLAAASTLLMAVLFHAGHDVSRVYYGTDTRAQELLLGTALAVLFTMWGYARTRVGRVVLHVAGGLALVVLAWAWSTVDGGRPALYRGGLALLAVCVVLVIASAIQPGPNPLQWLLSRRPLVGIGLISYGLYLWHWPVYVWLTTSRTGIHDDAELLALRFVVTFAIAVASYVLVEMPIRRQTWRMPRLRTLAPIAMATLVVVAVVSTTGGSSTQNPLRSLERAAARSARPPHTATPAVTHLSPPPASKPFPIPLQGRQARIYVAGDSVALSFGVGLATAAGDQAAVWNRGIFGCGLADGTPTTTDGAFDDPPPCADDHAAWVEEASHWHSDVVVVFTNVWDTFDRVLPDGTELRFGTPQFDAAYEDQVQSLIGAWAERGIRVALLTPPCIDAADYTLGDLNARWASFDPTRVAHLAMLVRDVARKLPDAAAAFPLDEQVCPHGQPVRTVDGALLRYDGVHFSASGSAWVSRWLLPQLLAP